MNTIELTQEQKQVLVVRAQCARYGVNLDKATLRLLARDMDTRPTLKAIPIEVEKLRLQTVNPL